MEEFLKMFEFDGEESGEGENTEAALKAMAEGGGFQIPGLPDLSKIGEHMEKFMGELSTNVEEATKRGVLSAFAELKEKKDDK